MNRILQATALGVVTLLSAHVPATSSTSLGTSGEVHVQELELDGLIEPYADLNVGAQVDGVIAKIPVDRGDMLEAGQVVARLESDLEETQLELQRARAESTAQIDSAREAVKLSKQRAARTRKLFEEKVISWGALEEVETELRIAELRLIDAEDTRRMAQIEVRRAEALLAQRTIYSPISGIVVERYLGEGELVYRANSDQILRIAQIDPLLVEIIAPLSTYGRIAVGDTVTVHPDSPVGGSVQAKVTVVDRVIDAASGTIGIRCELENKDHKIPAGLRCRVRLNLREGK